MLFENLNINNKLLKVLQEKEYSEATEIQQKAIPHILKGRDLIGCAQTGTGKTAAFAIPILDKLSKCMDEVEQPIQALVLAPTRELAIQIGESFENYGKYTSVKTGVVFGGITPKRHIKVLKKKPSIVVATPGRLLDLIGKGVADLSQVKYLVLDEADRMLDLGMIKDVNKILASLPAKRQNMLFSATMPKGVMKMIRSMLRNPISVKVSQLPEEKKVIEQQIYVVEETEKTKLVLHLLNEINYESILIFARTKKKADKLSKAINATNVRTKAIHGDKNQSERHKSLQLFKDKEIKILIATDVAARGLDIDHISHVINMNIPNVPETYIHRIGRTGRAGRKGIAISFCSSQELEFLGEIEKLQNSKIQVVKEHPFVITK